MILGTAGFLLYFIYDINSIYRKYPLLQSFFAVGTVCVVWSLLWTMKDAMAAGFSCNAKNMLCLAGCLIFLGLLVYTLFFAIPFEDTYVKENQPRKACTQGVYGLCRHPGVLWYGGLLLCLWSMTGEIERGAYFLPMILWNCLYVLFQDQWTFPRTFFNYEEYKKSTPFLCPNKKSIQACFSGNRVDKT
jgi:protein-S-isoprenylcysteine O-methyltransferase Ste14